MPSAVLSLGIVHFLEDSSRIRQRLCRVAYADTPLRPYADTVVVFGCGSAVLSWTTGLRNPADERNFGKGDGSRRDR
jgi:hypothetical protein